MKTQLNNYYLHANGTLRHDLCERLWFMLLIVVAIKDWRKVWAVIRGE